MANAATIRLQNDLNRGRISIYDTESARVLNSNRYSGADIAGVQRVYFEENLSDEMLDGYRRGQIDPLRDTRSEVYNPQDSLRVFGEELFRANDPDADLFLTDPEAYNTKVQQTMQSELQTPIDQRTRPFDQFGAAAVQASQTGQFVPYPDGTAGGYAPNGAVITVDSNGVATLLSPDGGSVNETFQNLNDATNYVNTEQTNPETGAYATRMERSLLQSETGKPDFAYLNQEEIRQVVNQSNRYAGARGIVNEIRDFGLGAASEGRSNRQVQQALSSFSSDERRYLQGNTGSGIPDDPNVITNYIQETFPEQVEQPAETTTTDAEFAQQLREEGFVGPEKIEGGAQKTFYAMRGSNKIFTASDSTTVPKSAVFTSPDRQAVQTYIEQVIEKEKETQQEQEKPEETTTPTTTEQPATDTTTDALGETQPAIDTTTEALGEAQPTTGATSTIPTFVPEQAQTTITPSPNISTTPITGGTTYTAPSAQPQFTSPNVNPYTGTTQTQTSGYVPSAAMSQFGGPQITTGVYGQSGSSYTPTLTLQSGYQPSGYRPTFSYQQGGMAPNMQQQNMPMTQMFGGFKPEAMQRIAGSLGYQGDMSGFNSYLDNNPDKKQKMNMYNQKAMQMVNGGMAIKFQDGGTYTPSSPRPLGQQYIPPQEIPESGKIQDVAATQALYPGLPLGATVVPVGATMEAGQFVDPRSGQVGGPVGIGTATAGTTEAGLLKASDTTLMESADSAGAVDATVSGLEGAKGTLGQQSLVGAQQQTETSVAGLEAAQGTATLIDNPVTREIQSGELVTGAADAEKAAKFTEQIQAAEATPSEKATVQGQLEGLMQDFEGGATPAWAAGAMRAVSAQMAARGLGASSMAGQAMVQAAMESALPIAQADAATQASFEAQNLSNRQQRAILAAQQRAQFIGQEFDQAFQSRVANAAKVSDVANMNFTAEQQIALENSRAANTMNLANLNNSQAMVMAEAAALANLDMANLSNRQQAAVQNAQNFLQMDMANLSNQQQTDMFKAQSRIQSLFNDQAARNAAAQFNATSQNQTDQFFASLANSTAQFNAAQSNAQSQFNAGQVNTVERFNIEVNNQREQFNASNRLVIDQANAQWRREIATADTAAVNRANEVNAENLLGVSRDAFNNIWQYYSDNMEWAWTASENEKARITNLAIAELGAETDIDLANMKQDYASSMGFGSLIGTMLTTNLENTLMDTLFGGIFG